jgi:hypothetical protein
MSLLLVKSGSLGLDVSNSLLSLLVKSSESCFILNSRGSSSVLSSFKKFVINLLSLLDFLSNLVVEFQFSLLSRFLEFLGLVDLDL